MYLLRLIFLPKINACNHRTILYGTLYRILEKIAQNIKLGTKTWFNKIGLVLYFMGFLSVIGFFILWASGNSLPSEMQFLYYGFVIGDSLLYSGVTGFILTLLGFRLANFRIYENTKLIFQPGEKIQLISKAERIEIKNWQIGKIFVHKEWFSNDYKFWIKTTTNKEYYLKADKSLIDKFSIKL